MLFLLWSCLFELWGCPLEAQKAKNKIENEQRWCPCCFIMFKRWSHAVEVGSDQFAPHGGKIASLSSSFHALLFILHLSYFLLAVHQCIPCAILSANCNIFHFLFPPQVKYFYKKFNVIFFKIICSLYKKCKLPFAIEPTYIQVVYCGSVQHKLVGLIGYRVVVVVVVFCCFKISLLKLLLTT